MIEIHGTITGHEVIFKFESPASCNLTLWKLRDWFDLKFRKNCPVDCDRCEYVKHDNYMDSLTNLN